MIISDGKLPRGRITESQERQEGDLLDMKRFNLLPSPVTARLIGGSEWWIETLDVKTGAMRVDVCGMIDCLHFTDVAMLIDYEGNEHDPDEFWLEC